MNAMPERAGIQRETKAGQRRSARWVFFVVVSSLSASLTTSCGGGSGLAAAPAIARVEPSALFAREPSAMRLIGNGFGKRGTDVILRLTAVSGSPFDDGSSNTFETTLEVESDVQIRGDIAATNASEATEAILSLHYPGGGVIDGGDLRLLIEPQSLESIAPDLAGPDTVGDPFVITGLGFRPPDGLVTVRFDAVAGTPFLGGSHPFVTTSGIVTSPTTIQGLFPAAGASDLTTAYVTIALPSSGEITSAPTALVTFEPTPTILTFNPAVVANATTPPFSVLGAGFFPPGSAATVTLLADSGSPFLGGTSSTLVLNGTVQSATAIDGTFVDPAVTAATLATVQVDLVGGASVTSAVPLVQILPAPVISSISPDEIETGSSVAFLLAGENFAPVGGSVALSFQADSGTPFNNGTEDTISVTGSIASNTQIGGTLPDPMVDADATCTITGAFSTGATATSPSGVLLVKAFDVPVFDSTLGSAITTWTAPRGIPAEDDGYSQQSFTGGFTFPFLGTSHSSVYVGTNGYVTFNQGLTDQTYSSTEFLSGPPRISALWDDLDPSSASGSGDVFIKHLADRVVVTWSAVPEWNGSGGIGSNTVQIVLYDTGRIDLLHGGVSDEDGLTGISPGGGAGSSSPDFSATQHPSRSTLSSGTAAFEIWSSPGSDLDPGWIYFLPLPAGGYEWASGP